MVTNQAFARVLLLLFVLFSLKLPGQELFPHNEPASNVGKNVLAVRVSSETYSDLGQPRDFQYICFRFGLSSKWMLSESFFFSNHHGSLLPGNFIRPDSVHGPSTTGVARGKYYPYLFESMNLNLKYRFLARDSEHRHFRVAAYLDLSGGNEAHAEAEPNLMGDTGGAGLGLISTLLLHKFAVSVNAGGILPSPYQEAVTGITINYGKAAYLNLSMGYLLFPRVYSSYKQLNVNLYAEFQCMTYGGAVITDNGASIRIVDAPALQANSYIEFRPSVQFIIRSNMRLDLSLGIPVYGRSWNYTCPVYFVTLQQAVFFKDGK